MGDQVAILLDGGFVKKRLWRKLHHEPTTADVVGLTTTIMGHDRLKDAGLFRVYFYDAPPFQGTGQNPLDPGVTIDFSRTHVAKTNQSLIDSLELQPDFAVRRGRLAARGWKLSAKALRSLQKKPRQIQASDLIPDLEQKGVDLRIGLDMATIALRRVVTVLVVVSGDSDLVPAMKFARTEGLKVYLEALGHPIHREMRAHADVLL